MEKLTLSVTACQTVGNILKSSLGPVGYVIEISDEADRDVTDSAQT